MTDDTYTDADKHLLAGRYQVGQRIGGGRMTDVYRAQDTELGKTVAIKILNEDIAEDTTFAERFIQEAKAFADDDGNPDQTKHPNVVPILDAGVDEGQHYVVMEFVRGKTLADVLREQGALPHERAMEITESVCRGLSFAQSHGVIHRDITPSNILIADDDTVMLMDAGVARPTSATTAAQTAAMLGNAHYISPELARGGEPFARSDIYSLGIVLYEMLTGRPPFPGESPVAVAMQHVRESPKRPNEVDPSIPAALSDITMKCLAKNPGERYGTPDDLRVELEKLRGAGTTVSTENANTQVIHTGTGADTMVFTSAAASQGRQIDPKYIIGALVALLVIGIVVFLLFLRTEEVEVPNLVGQRIENAQSALASLGLKAGVINQVSRDGQNIGVVIEQAPPPLTNRPPGSTVTLIVPVLPQQKAVPDFTNTSIDAARAQIQSLGFTMGTITEQPSTVAEGLVIGQDPAPTTMVDPGSVINLTVSAGQDLSVVPSVVCLKVNDAAVQLDQAGLKMTIAGVESNSLCTGGGARIARQEPTSGIEAPNGTIVEVWTTQEPSPQPSASPTSPSPSPTA